MFRLRIPADSPALSPDVTLHLGIAASHLQNQIDNLKAVEQLTAIEEENATVLAMSYGLTAILEKLEGVHQHFAETIELIEPALAGKGGTA